jgi:phage tail-like protein
MTAGAWKRLGPLTVFNFDVVFSEVTLPDGGIAGTSGIRLCGAQFSEVTGLEATMEPKVIKEGGRNFGVLQRVGPVTFATVVLKRGIGQIDDLWRWFELVSGGAYGKRLTAVITLYGPEQGTRDAPIYQWRLHRALPTKFKTADLNATSTAVGIEELHIAHEGLELPRPAAPAPAAPGPGGAA